MKKTALAFCITTLACGFISCSHSKSSENEIRTDRKVVQLYDKNSHRVGEVILTPAEKGTRVQLNAKGLPPGEHGFHFHEMGLCQAPTFESAGGHFSPDHTKHGDVRQGPHAGDMDNIVVGNDGTAMVDRVEPHVTLVPGRNAITKPGGTAIVIHAKADDYRTQPSGGSGERIACGVVPESIQAVSAPRPGRDLATPTTP